jgi:uncharacterized membrane protein YgdD (TMEM256/DUF423 family)
MEQADLRSAAKSGGFLTNRLWMSSALALRIAAVMGAAAVALGAFGAHALKDLLSSNGTAATWQTAVFYHFIHAVMLFVLASRSRLLAGPWISFLVGIILFSGSLYLLAVTNLRWLGAITPFGGICFIVGWIWLAICPRNAEP